MRPKGNLAIDREGRWLHEGVEITHGRTLDLFFRSLKRDSAGRYYIEVGPEQATVIVEDTPYVVRRIEESRPSDGVMEGFTIFLNDSTSEPLDMGSLEVGPDDVLYCRVKGGEYKARFLRAPYYHLAEYIEEDPGTGGYCLRVGEVCYPIRARGKS